MLVAIQRGTSAHCRERPSAAEIASVTINSDIPDAEVEVDGGFIGNTPSTAKLGSRNTQDHCQERRPRLVARSERAAGRHGKCQGHVEKVASGMAVKRLGLIRPTSLL